MVELVLPVKYINISNPFDSLHELTLDANKRAKAGSTALSLFDTEVFGWSVPLLFFSVTAALWRLCCPILNVSRGFGIIY